MGITIRKVGATDARTRRCERVVVRVTSLAGLAVFDGLPAWALEVLVGSSREVGLDAGEFVLHQHDEAQAVSILLSGTVQFLLRFEGVDDLLVGSTTQPGALIGWSVFRPPYRNTATVRCEQPCRFLQVPRSAFDEVFAADPRLHYEILGRVAGVAAERLKDTRHVLLMTSGLIPREGE